jgi:hypothetical protein
MSDVLFETMRMRGPDGRSLAPVARPVTQCQAAASAALEVRASIAIVVRASTTTAEPKCGSIEPTGLAPLIEQAPRQDCGPPIDRPNQIIPGDARAAYQRRPPTPQSHQLDRLI